MLNRIKNIFLFNTNKVYSIEELCMREFFEKDFSVDINQLTNREKIIYNNTKDYSNYELKDLSFTSKLHIFFKKEYLRKATKKDYLTWIEHRESSFTHEYNYNFNDFYVAVKDFYMIPFFGSSSLNIIISQNIKVTCPNSGHNKLYFMDERKEKPSWIPNYLDLYEE